MKTLFKKVTIIDPNSKYNKLVKDLYIESGKIKKIDNNIEAQKDFQIIEEKDLHVSPGLFDPTVHFCDPGEEQKEDLESGILAAKKGGYTALGILGITHPSITEKTRVEYLIHKANGTGIKIHPIGCVSAKNEGKEMAELYDMQQAGAIGFYDGKKQINAGLMNRTLAYAKNLNTVILSFPDEHAVSYGGLIHEGLENIKLGLKGIPSIAEEIAVVRDIYLSEYNQSNLHFANISTKKSVELIEQAKKRGVKITAQCSVHHLYFSDKDLFDFDSNLKILPPLRSNEDQHAIIEGLKNGTINTITSDHYPQDIESKKMEFDLAEYGATGIETCFSVANTVLNKPLGLEKIITLMAIESRKIFGLEIPVIKEGNNAEICFYKPNEKFVWDKKNKQSKGYNDPYIGKELTGKVYNFKF